MIFFLFFYFFFFFFKQKTAYEMRISDWSSDVCSSDLEIGVIFGVEIAIGNAEVEIVARPQHQFDIGAVDFRRRRIAYQARRRAAAQIDDARYLQILIVIMESGDVEAQPPVEPFGFEADFVGRDIFGLEQDIRLGGREGHILKAAALESRRSEEHTSELQSLMR